MLFRLTIALVQVKTGKRSNNILNQNRQNIYSLCWGKEKRKLLKIYNEFSKGIIKREYRIIKFNKQ